jgi:regulator of RNase E activity RraA
MTQPTVLCSADPAKLKAFDSYTMEIDNLKITSGDLLTGDLHRIVAIPLSIATEVPKAASDIQRRERESRFSLQGLSERIRNMNLCCDLSRSGAE